MDSLGRRIHSTDHSTHPTNSNLARKDFLTLSSEETFKNATHVTTICLGSACLSFLLSSPPLALLFGGEDCGILGGRVNVVFAFVCE